MIIAGASKIPSTNAKTKGIYEPGGAFDFLALSAVCGVRGGHRECEAPESQSYVYRSGLMLSMCMIRGWKGYFTGNRTGRSN